jgi:S-adenosyl methyltransferase
VRICRSRFTTAWWPQVLLGVKWRNSAYSGRLGDCVEAASAWHPACRAAYPVSPLPTAGNVHDVAQNLNPGCRVVYVDIDPEVVAESHNLLTGNHDAEIALADLRQPEQVLDAAGRCGLLDLGAPVAVLAIDMLHHIPDADNPAGFIAAYVDAVCPGSYVPVAHTGDNEALATGLATFHDGYHVPVPLLTFRNPTQITGFFDEPNLVEPGIVPFRCGVRNQTRV